MQKELGTGIRHNEGKLRYDLVNPLAHEGMVDVLTFGANKYSDHNWEAGMAWTKVIQSLKRHLAAIEKGEDYDEETGKLHADHVQCNAHFLSAYYRIFPQGDDRYLLNRPQPKIGLDIDDVICSWVEEWAKLQNIPIPTDWNFDYDLQKKFEGLRTIGALNNFYLGLPVKEKPEDIHFIPECYITHRPVVKAVTELWLRENGFPLKPVFQVNDREEKLKIAKEQKLDIFVDDNFDTFTMMNQNGICCFLYDAMHNQRHNVGYKRIKSLKEIKV
jgi:5'(3')-deoxyribonucleotidase